MSPGGRPPEPNPRDVVVKVRVKAEERAQWQAKADAAGLTLSAWVRRRLNGSKR